MNIIFLTHEFVQNNLTVGGAGNYLNNITRIMIKNGHTVYVVVDSEKEGVSTYNGIYVHCICATKMFKKKTGPISTFEKVIRNLARSYAYNHEVKKIMDKTHIDLVQSVDEYSIPLLRSHKVPYVVRFSEYEPLWIGASKENYYPEEWIYSKRLDMIMWKKAYQKADALISPSELVKKLVAYQSGQNVEVVESPVIIGETDDDILERINPDKKQYFLTFGALTHRKSIKMLAGLIDKILDRYPEMNYMVVGKDRKIAYGEDRIWVSEFFDMSVVCNKDRFVFVDGVSNRNQIFSIIKNACLCILPTRIDNLPNAVLEAMAFGKLVISSDRTSVEQVITDGYNGFLTKIDDAEELYQKINYVMKLPGMEKMLIGNRAIERMKALTPEKVYEKMMKVYKKSIQNFRGKQ